MHTNFQRLKSLETRDSFDEVFRLPGIAPRVSQCLDLFQRQWQEEKWEQAVDAASLATRGRVKGGGFSLLEGNTFEETAHLNPTRTDLSELFWPPVIEGSLTTLETLQFIFAVLGRSPGPPTTISKVAAFLHKGSTTLFAPSGC